MRLDRRRRRAGSAKYRTPVTAKRPSPRRTRGTTCSRDGSGLHKPWTRKTCGRSFEPLAVLDAVLPFGIDHGHEANDAAVTAVPVPWEERERTAPAGDLV